jgi:hypothetical protein
MWLLVIAKRFPKFTTGADEAEGKQMRKKFGLIFGIEGTAIPLACIALQFTGNGLYILPAIALIVGLHFYPMAKIFKRKIDYYLGTWASLLAIMVIGGVHEGLPQPSAVVMLGIGMALTTSIYGFYMVVAGYKLTHSQTLL